MRWLTGPRRDACPRAGMCRPVPRESLRGAAATAALWDGVSWHRLLSRPPGASSAPGHGDTVFGAAHPLAHRHPLAVLAAVIWSCYPSFPPLPLLLWLSSPSLFMTIFLFPAI